MTVLKLSSKGGQVQLVVTERVEPGTVYVSSKQWVKNLFDGRVASGFIELSMLPERISPDRFRKSPVVLPDEDWKKIPYEEATRRGVISGYGNLKEDAYSPQRRKEEEEKKAFTDEDIDW